MHGFHLREPHGEDHIAVVLEPVEARATVPLILSAYGLGERDAAVAKLVLRGDSTHAIVNTLHMPQQTVQDHLKAVFAETGVHSRRELAGRILGQPTPSKPEPAAVDRLSASARWTRARRGPHKPSGIPSTRGERVGEFISSTAL